MTRRTVRSGSSGPTPTLCESTRFLCRSSSWSSGICVCASLPKPVLMPHTGPPASTMRRTEAAPSARRVRVAESSSSFSSDPAKETIWPSVSFPGSSRMRRALSQAQPRFEELEEEVDEEREGGGGKRTGEQQVVVVERKPLRDALAEAARTDERGDRRGPDVDDRRGLHPREDRGERERQLDQGQRLARDEPQRARRIPQARGDFEKPRVRVARDREEGVEEERDHRRPHADEIGR